MTKMYDYIHTLIHTGCKKISSNWLFDYNKNTNTRSPTAGILIPVILQFPK